MIALVTSCGRFDLLADTLKSLNKNQKHELIIFVNEDCGDPLCKPEIIGEIKGDCGYFFDNLNVVFSEKIGQHKSIEKLLRISNDKYYLHCEDDWEFNNTYDWIQTSIDIMEADPTIIKVLCNSDSPHPCRYDRSIFGGYCRDYMTGETSTSSVFHYNYGYIEPWEDPWHKTLWHGFSWNPGVTRLDLLKKFVPFGKWEQDVAKSIYDAGYKVVRLENGVCKHIGEGRSTH